MKKLLFYFFSITILLSSCTPELELPEPSAGTADFSKFIAIGGSFLAGYQDGALFEQGQRLSIPALLAQQFEWVDGSKFNQVFMPDNNGLGLNPKVWESWFVSSSRLAYLTDCKGLSYISPIKNTIAVSAALPYLSGMAGNSNQNISVPFATIADYFNPAFGNSFSSGNKNPFYHRIASYPTVSSMYSDAQAQSATFVTVWTGMEDVFNYAASGAENGAIASSSSFSMYLDSLLNGLTKNGAKGVIANIPDFRSFAYYNTLKWNDADLTQLEADSLNLYYATLGMTQIQFKKGTNAFVIQDPNASMGYRQLVQGEYITLSVPMDSIKCNNYGLKGDAIDSRYVLDSTEVLIIDQAIHAYNTIIQQKAAQYGFAFVDMYSFFKTVESGIKWNGQAYNATFVGGGFYSLDGYHPNQKGYALIANEFINAINNKFNAVIPPVNCVECNGVLFP